MAYIGTQPKDIRSFGKAKFDFTATQGQTAFTGADDDGKTLGFTDGQISVYVNGILMDESDYTTSGSNTVTLTSAANLNDIISVVALQTDIPNSDYVPATGGTFSGAVTFDGAFTSQGIDDNATSTAMTLDSSGNLLVGLTSSTDGTNAGVRARADGFLAATREGSATQATAYFNKKTNDGDIVGFYKDGSTVGSIGTLSSRLHIENGDTGLRIAGDLDQIFPCGSGGGDRDAAIDLGSTGVRFKDLYLSGGVYLGGVGSANYLDSYEEGTWTLVPPTGVSIGTTGTGRYTKVGRKVTVSGLVSVGSTSGGAYFDISGLPFTSGPNSYANNTQGVMHQHITAQQIQAFIGNNQSYIRFYACDGGAWDRLQANEVSTASDIYFTITYEAA